MSLLVVNSSNRIAHGVIQSAYLSQKYEKIICADVYPNIDSHLRFINFIGDLKQNNQSSSTVVEDIKIQEKSDLQTAIQRASHCVYVTHDYYSLVPSKLNMIKFTAELTKKYKTKRFLAYTPIEHDNYFEIHPLQVVRESELEAQEANPDMVLFKSDLTFGDHSTLMNYLQQRISLQQNIYFKPINKIEPSFPIYCGDASQIINDSLLTDGIQLGASYLLRGPREQTMGDLINQLQKRLSQRAVLNSSTQEDYVNPTEKTLLSEKLYDPEYMNYTRFMRDYSTIDTSLYKEVDFVGDFKYTDINDIYVKQQKQVVEEVIQEQAKVEDQSQIEQEEEQTKEGAEKEESKGDEQQQQVDRNENKEAFERIVKRLIDRYIR